MSGRSRQSRGSAAFEPAVALTEPAGQRDCREDESWTTRAERRGCALVAHRGASGGQSRRIGTDPWKSAETERSCGPRKRRAQRCGRELEPETSRGIRSRAGRSLKTGATGHRGSEIQRPVAADGKRPGEMKGHLRTRRHSPPSSWWSPRTEVSGQRFWIAGIINAGLPRVSGAALEAAGPAIAAF